MDYKLSFKSLPYEADSPAADKDPLIVEPGREQIYRFQATFEPVDPEGSPLPFSRAHVTYLLSRAGQSCDLEKKNITRKPEQD